MGPEWYETLRDEAIATFQLPDIYTQDYREEGRTLASSDFSNDHLLCALSFQGGDTSLRRLADLQEIATISGIDEVNRGAPILSAHDCAHRDFDLLVTARRERFSANVLLLENSNCELACGISRSL